MIPYSNRIENGTFSFEGRTYQLRNRKDHAIHGDVRFRAWSVKEFSHETMCCEFNTSDYSDINWPWPFEARAEYKLIQYIFSSSVTIWNRGNSTMPAGLGWHPFFSRKMTCEKEPVHLSFIVEGLYPDANNNRIRAGPPVLPEPALDFSTEKPLPCDYFIDVCYQGYDGNGYIVWPKSKLKLSFECSSAFSHLVLYNPIYRGYFAIEPVTNANNGVNLYARGEINSGIIPLLPGESLEASFNLRVDQE